MIDGPFRRHLPYLTGGLIRFYQNLGAQGRAEGRHQWRLKPNHLTLAGFVAALLAAGLIALQWFWPACLIWWIGRIFDGTDGIYARETGQQTDFGGYLDILLDMASYSVVLVGFWIAFPAYGLSWLLISILYTLCITSALALGAFEKSHHLGQEDHRSLRLAHGLAEGGETGIFYTMVLIWPTRVGILVSVWIAILLFTVLARTLLAYRLMGGQGHSESHGS